jgi:hypothetical protein
VRLTQERFRIGTAKVNPLTWRIPVRSAFQRPQKQAITRLLGGTPLEEPSLAREAWKANLGDTGYYRVRYLGPLFGASPCQS